MNGKPFASLLTPRCIKDFLERNNIVCRRLKGKKQASEEKQMDISRAVARYLGSLKRQFQGGLLDPEHQCNMDESHFVIDLDDGKTLDFVGTQSVKNHSIVSDRECITMCVLLNGGSNARILCPMLIFKN
ncbi:hypothetical protein PR003_g6548 [Phytophthora rubi]|uniref:DDE-1 domain-containing protein n=1 Tax=Phytophthora rubi TaxID=129364 RepID=A0A6A3MX53_9STRA|nr:hypothetical protein PR001_g8262 [Phytophthora rubi]KAE9348188.1 hypothetical protein PR003_g6548 [Phytophthora rubi]